MEINEMANKNIHQLKLYLAQLPSSLPVPSNPHPDFRQFAPKAGVLPGDKAVQEALEAAMGPFNSSNFVIRERGPGIQALGDVLERYLAQYPLSLPLQQWLYMALLAAENTFRRYNIKLPSLDAQPQVAPTMIMSVPPRAGQARYSATSFRSYYAPAPTTPGLFANGLSPTGFSSALRASERTASTLSAQSATASRETSRTSNPTLTSKDKGTKMIPTARKPSEATVPRRAKSTPKTKHEAYSAPVIVLDERLMQHVEALMMTRPCLRTHSYLVPKLPWLSGWIPDNTLLETALQRHIAFSVCTGASDVDNAASGSSDAAEQVHNHDLLLVRPPASPLPSY
ncbi:hypothetical protein PENSPDRAFT_445765 [Peniophora sp. CONT]|nr:hypothetical protein PENSPDRAFT_445765 [Peniophora sp. CONT]